MTIPANATQKDATIISKIAVVNEQYCPETKEQLQVLVKYPEISLDAINTAEITDMSHLFENSKRKEFAGINTWDTSKVTDMSYMFAGCERFNEELGAQILATSLVGKLLKRASKSRFDTSNVTNMSHMFEGCVDFNKPLKLNTAKCQDFSCFLKKCKDFNSVIELDTRAAVNMNRMFEACVKFNQALNLDTKNVQNMGYMFRHCRAFNQALNFNTSSCENFNAFLVSCTQFNQPLKFDTSKAKKLNLMFEKCVNLDCQMEFDLSAAQDISRMFSECTRLSKTPVLKNLDNVSKAEDVFKKCDKLSNVPDMSAYNKESEVSAKASSGADDVNLLNINDIEQILLTDNGSMISTLHFKINAITQDNKYEIFNRLKENLDDLGELYLSECEHKADYEFIISDGDSDDFALDIFDSKCQKLSPNHIQLNQNGKGIYDTFFTDEAFDDDELVGFYVVVAGTKSYYQIDMDDLRKKAGNKIDPNAFYYVNQDYQDDLFDLLGLEISSADASALDRIMYAPDPKATLASEVGEQKAQEMIDESSSAENLTDIDYANEELKAELESNYIIKCEEESNHGVEVQVFFYHKDKTLLYKLGTGYVRCKQKAECDLWDAVEITYGV